MAIWPPNYSQRKSLWSLRNYVTKIVWNCKIMCQIMDSLRTVKSIKIMDIII